MMPLRALPPLRYDVGGDPPHTHTRKPADPKVTVCQPQTSRPVLLPRVIQQASVVAHVNFEIERFATVGDGWHQWHDQNHASCYAPSVFVIVCVTFKTHIK